MNILHLINPTTTSATLAVLIGSAILFAMYKARVVIISTLARVGSQLFTRTGFFWTVNLIFMAVSVLHAGMFFGITGNAHSTPGIGQLLGFAVSFFLDLVTIILMQAMLEARYRGEVARARQFLFFIAICCATSTFANLAISLNDFDPQTFLPHAPIWIQVASPYVLASFPLFVIMMSLAAEMILHVRPLEKLEEEEYEADEKKRVRIMEIRNIYLERQVQEELRSLSIRAQMKANKQQYRSGLFSQRQKQQSVDVQSVVAQLKATYDTQIAELKQQLAVQTNQSIQVVQIQQPQQESVVASENMTLSQNEVVALPVENDVAFLEEPVIVATQQDVTATHKTDELSKMRHQKESVATRQQVLEYVATKPDAKPSEIASHLDVSVRTVQRYLKNQDTTLTHDAGGLVLVSEEVIS
jgi:predicted transcriptional regulator